MTTHLIADCHFFHASMLTFCPATRPYSVVESMSDAMASAWRRCVKLSDDIIVLGDFAHRANPAELKKLFASLPGRKHLIVGNHDTERSGTLSLPWESIRDIAHVSIDTQRVVLCHNPMLSWNGSRRGVIQLYGHHHGKLPGNQQSCDIGVEVMGIAPVRLNQIKSYMRTLPPRVDPEGGDDLENDGVQP